MNLQWSQWKRDVCLFEKRPAKWKTTTAQLGWLSTITMMENILPLDPSDWKAPTSVIGNAVLSWKWEWCSKKHHLKEMKAEEEHRCISAQTHAAHGTGRLHTERLTPPRQLLPDPVWVWLLVVNGEARVLLPLPLAASTCDEDTTNSKLVNLTSGKHQWPISVCAWYAYSRAKPAVFCPSLLFALFSSLADGQHGPQ